MSKELCVIRSHLVFWLSVACR